MKAPHELRGGDLAYPCQQAELMHPDERGLTIRELYAKDIFCVLVAASIAGRLNVRDHKDQLAERAYELADALLLADAVKKAAEAELSRDRGEDLIEVEGPPNTSPIKAAFDKTREGGES